jgi:GNAT superfamily N-acetyltransferase
MTLDLPDLTFRAYDVGDLAAVRALHRGSFAALAAGHYTPAQIAAHDVLIAGGDYAADLARSHVTLAATSSGEIVATAGWIALAGEAETARIRKLFVAPALARRGLGRRLLAKAEDGARAAGHRRFFLRAYLNAVPLYESRGYSADHGAVMSLPGGVEMPVLFMRK